MANNTDDTKKLVGFVNLKQTWTQLLPMMLTVYADGSEKGRQAISGELERMAKPSPERGIWEVWSIWTLGPGDYERVTL